MSAFNPIIAAQSAPPVRLALFGENSNGLASLRRMLDFYARDFIGLVDALAEIAFKGPLGICPPRDLRLVPVYLRNLHSHCVALGLTLSAAQIVRIVSGGAEIPLHELSTKLVQLRERIDDELMHRTFYAISPDRMEYYDVFGFEDTDGNKGVRVRLKNASDVFGEHVTEKLPTAIDDLDEAIMCFVLGRNKACVFHLMQGIEVAVLKVARMVGNDDPKPSWGAVLKQVEKLVLRTDYKARTDFVNQHISFLERVLVEMQAIQRSWRNKVSHVEDRIVPTGAYSPEVTHGIFVAVRVFIREIAADLPDPSVSGVGQQP